MTDLLAENLGKAARAARERLGFTQAEVAELVEMTTVVYNRMERGKLLPGVRTLTRLCEVLRVSPEELLGFKPPAKGARSRPANEDPPSVHQLTSLARRLDETQREVLIAMARVLLR
jgi:transcriptional regulator with XRE-family HTH domain